MKSACSAPHDALASYRKWYAPNNAILVIAGDVDLAEVRPLAERYFGPIPAQSLPARARVEEPLHHAAARVEMKSARAAQPQWNRSYLAPSYRAGETAQAYPLQVLAEILGGGVGSRLYKTLVLDRGLALSAGAHYSPSAIDLTVFGLYATPKPDVSVADLEAAIDGELRRLCGTGSNRTRSGVRKNVCRPLRSMPGTAFQAHRTSSARGLPSVRAWTRSRRGPTGSGL